jgi:hypothetical protein
LISTTSLWSGQSASTRQLLGVREALGERLLDDPLERQVGEGAGEVDDRDRAHGDGQALHARHVAAGQVDAVDPHARPPGTLARPDDDAERRHGDRTDPGELRRHLEAQRPVGHRRRGRPRFRQVVGDRADQVDAAAPAPEVAPPQRGLNRRLRKPACTEDGGRVKSRDVV